MLQWNNHPHFLVDIRSKQKVTQNIFNLHEWHQNAQQKIFIQANMAEGIKKLETCQEWTHLLSGRLWRCFIRQPLAQDDHFWVVPRVVVWYRLDSNIYLVEKSGLNKLGNLTIKILINWLLVIWILILPGLILMRLGVYFKTVHILIISGSKIDFFISTNQFLKSLCFTEIETE